MGAGDRDTESNMVTALGDVTWPCGYCEVDGGCARAAGGGSSRYPVPARQSVRAGEVCLTGHALGVGILPLARRYARCGDAFLAARGELELLDPRASAPRAALCAKV